jgi:hypothetical protein
MRKRLSRGAKFVAFAVLATAVFCLVGLIVTGLWNALMPALFGQKAITFWQAIGLMFLLRFLFGGFRGRAGWPRHWRHRMMERWEQMTPEEREKFRDSMRGRRCGPFAPPPVGPAAEGPAA